MLRKALSVPVLPLLLVIAAGVSAGPTSPNVAAAPRPRVDVTALRAQLASVTLPEPTGELSVDYHGSAVRLARPGEPGVSVTVAALDLADAADVASTNLGEARTFALGDVDVVQLATRHRYEELRLVPHATSQIELAYRVSLGAGLASVRVVDGLVEVLDHDGVARLRTEPAFAVDARGTRRALLPQLVGTTLTWRAATADLVAPIAIDPAWTTTAALAFSRSNGKLFPLPGGKKWMIVGGRTATGGTTEIYDVATASWTTGPAMLHPRLGPVAQLADGRIFMAAGDTTESPPAGDLFDPAKGAWKTTVVAPSGYVTPTLTALGGAKFLVVGGPGASVYDADANTWTKTAGASLEPRRSPTVTLADGRALLVGGTSFATGEVIASAEIFDPSTGSFTTAGSLSVARQGFSVNRLIDGRVLVVGGYDASASATLLRSTELFDPTTGKWSAGPDLPGARYFHSTALLGDGRLLVAGGDAASVLLTSTLFLDKAVTGFTPAGAMHDARSSFAMVEIDSTNGIVLAAGGYNGAEMRRVEVFTPLAPGKLCVEPGECVSGHCVDGVCCASMGCATGETCGGPATPGQCKKANGGVCAKGDECGSGLCVDGLCCDRACDGVCEACDVATSKGSCTTLAPGDAPHASHPKCPGDGVCAGLCGGVDAKSCTVFPGSATSCGAASCKDGVESSASTCDGAGKCNAPVTGKCEPFVCAATSCKRGCAVDADCAVGYSCDARSGRCVFGAKCDGDHVVVIPSGGGDIDCTPYRCAGSACIEKCSTSDDCVVGTTCDGSTGVCAPVQTDGGSSGGCATKAGGGPGFGLIAVVGLIALGLRRRGNGGGRR